MRSDRVDRIGGEHGENGMERGSGQREGGNVCVCVHVGWGGRLVCLLSLPPSLCLTLTRRDSSVVNVPGSLESHSTKSTGHSHINTHTHTQTHTHSP